MQVSINSTTQTNSNNNITDGNKGDITVSSQGTIWSINPTQLSNKFVYGEIPTGIVNGSNATFTSTNSFIPESLKIYINGIRQSIINDYITSGNNTITLFISPLITDSLIIDYIKT